MEAITLIFILSSIMIILTPGQDFILVMSRSIAQGQKAGIMTALGVSMGLLVHTVLATLGLGALLLASDWLFNAIKLIGAAYLIFMGYQLLKSCNHQLDMQSLEIVSYKKMFIQGAMSNIMNPKIAIFYFAYLPQFVVSNDTAHAWQLLALGVTFSVLTFCIKAPLGYLSGLLSFWIKTRQHVLTYVYKTSGFVLVALGLKLALSEKS